MKPEEPRQVGADHDEGFYRRWSERKLASHQAPVEPVEKHDVVEQPQPPGDEDMPPLESLDESSDYSGFLSPRVSEELRQLALRKLFFGSAFNVCDGLDDYAEDFTSFEKLGDLMTADLRHRLEREARREQAADEQAEKDRLANEDDEEPPRQLAEQPQEEVDEDRSRAMPDERENPSDEAET
jgi:hypothetical protein